MRHDTLWLTSLDTEELFTGAMKEATLFDDLVRKVSGDRSVAERLIEHEKQLKPGGRWLVYLQNAISRWAHEIR